MKSMLKNHMILKNQVTHVKAERDVMAEADDPWIVKLMYSFQVMTGPPRHDAGVVLGSLSAKGIAACSQCTSWLAST